MLYTQPLDFILVYSAWGLVLLTVLFATIYTWLRKSTGELWAAALDEDQLRTTKDMTPQQFADWIGDENLGRSAKEIDAMADKAHFGEGIPLPAKWPEGNAELGQRDGANPIQWHFVVPITNLSEPAPQAPTPTPLTEAHELLDEPELPAPVPVKRSRANMKPPAKRARKPRQTRIKNPASSNVHVKQSV